MQPVHYVCLAAGKGTRFGALGSYLQKCMYPVGLRPFLALSIENLLQSPGFNKDHRLTLIVGHFQEQVRAYFGNNYQGLNINYLEQPQALGTGHALYLAYQALQPQEPVMAWLADTYISTSLFAAMQQHSQRNVQTIAPGSADEKPDLKVTTRGEWVVQAWRGSEDYYDMGFWKLSPEVLALMMAERHQEYRMVPNLHRAIEQGHRVGYIKTDAWLHLGGTLPTPEDNVRAVVKRLFEL